MKNRKNLFMLQTLMIIMLLYLSDSVTAAASAQPNGEIAASPAAEPATGQLTEPVAGRLTEPTAAESKTELPPASAAAPDAGQPGEPTAVPETGQSEESTAGPEEEQPEEPDAGLSGEPAPVPERVSDGTELMDWLKSHEHTGGTVELTGDIVLDESFVFVWAGASPAEHILVETAGHTITVSGKAEFWSNAYLTFRGQTGAHGIFHVTEGGMLSLSGVVVENGQYGEQPSEPAAQYALWQEEGSGLVISDCRISGDIHYADTPFVMYKNATYVLVGEGQTAADVLPSEMKCSVNYRGQVSNNKPVQVTWNLAGTEEQQEKRLRFLVQGSFSHAVPEMLPVCAVVYNDYPLTFTEVEARVNGNFYIFRGGYTQPEIFPPMTVVSAYSFDGGNWFVCDDAAATEEAGTFFISLLWEQWNAEEHPYLYIRLEGESDGIRYFSNILRYEAGNLEAAEDCGGDRGGDTSIAAQSDETQKETDNAPVGDVKASDTVPAGDAGADTDTDTKPSGSAGDGTGTGTKPSGSAGGSTGTGTKTESRAGSSTGTDTKTSGTVPTGSAGGSADTGAEPTGSAGGSADTGAEPTGSAGGSADTGAEPSGSAGNSTGAGAELSGSRDSSGTGMDGTGSPSDTNGAEMTAISMVGTGQPLDTEQGGLQSRTIVIVLGFVVLSAVAGAAGFCFHTEIFRRLFHAVRKLFI